MINTRIIAKDSLGNSLGEFENFRSLKYGKRLNNYGTASFSVPIFNEKISDLVALRQNTIEILRDEVLIWAGEMAIREGNLDNKGDNWASLTSYDWLEQLNSRITVLEKIYGFQNGSDIVWDLVNTTQIDTNGNLGIIKGVFEDTTWREKTYNNQNIMEAIISLANLDNGFDFEIDNAKTFNLKNNIGIDRSNDVILEYGVNVTSARITEDFSKPATRAIVLGNTASSSDSIRTEVNSPSLLTLYKLREYNYNETEISDLSVFNAVGNSIIRKYGNPLLKVDLGIVRNSKPSIDDFSLGDTIRLKVKSGIYDIDHDFRVYEWSISYNADNTESLSLVLSDIRLEGSS